MEIIYGGRKLASCGQALFWGAWAGSIFFGAPGALIGAGLTALGPNCLALHGERLLSY